MIPVFIIVSSLFVALVVLVCLGTAFVGATRLFPMLQKGELLFQCSINVLTPIGWCLWMQDNQFESHPIFVAGLIFLSAGQLFYWDVRSLLSRGYSARILVDLYDAGGQVSSTNLKNHYAGGKGISGLLDKRMSQLRSAMLLKHSSSKLTWFGSGLARLGRTWRRLWAFQEVG